MFKKITSMNLLDSFSISINDLVQIMTQKRKGESMEDMMKLIKLTDSNNSGDMSFEEFEAFIETLLNLRQSLIQKGTNKLKELYGMRWDDEKLIAIEKSFVQICKTNIIFESPYISHKILINMLMLDKNLRKRRDIV